MHRYICIMGKSDINGNPRGWQIDMDMRTYKPVSYARQGETYRTNLSRKQIETVLLALGYDPDNMHND